jgi:hypothetical protein
MDRDDWLILFLSIILGILLPGWAIVLLPLFPLLLITLVCGLFRWK